MITDPIPRKASYREEFVRSDRLAALVVPGNDRLKAIAERIEAAMKREATDAYEAPKQIPRRLGNASLGMTDACAAFLSAASSFYKVRQPGISVLAARPLRARESGWTMELFGDYAPDRMFIRVWMRTAVLKRVTSFGTFFSTLCHEFCHHLDMQRFGFTRSPHTRGFYARAAALYHHARGTPMRPLVWRRIGRERWMIDWGAMRAGRRS